MPGGQKARPGRWIDHAARAYPAGMQLYTRWREPLAGLRRKVGKAGLSLHAAAVAYNAFLALVPLAVALVGAGAFIGRSAEVLDRVRLTLDAVAPEAVSEFIIDLFIEAGARLGGQQGWVIVPSALLALFLGSRAVVSLQKALAGAEERVEARRGPTLRLVALGLTVGGGLALAVISLLLVFGGRLLAFVEEWTGMGVLVVLWEWLRVPVSALGLFLFLLAFYRWGPPQPLPRAWLAALVGTAGASAASLGFGLYLALAPELGATFGVLGAVASALVWLYAGAYAILLGAVLVVYTTPSGNGQ
jgi:membrane protein